MSPPFPPSTAEEALKAATDFLCEIKPETLLHSGPYLLVKELKTYWSCGLHVGQVVTEEKIQEAKLFYQMHFKHQVFDEEAWRKVLEVGRSRL